MTHAEHYEQGGTWHGVLRIGGREVEGRGLFVRDHSWGPRNEQNFKAFWTATCLDEGRVFCNAIGIPQSERVVGIGAMVDEGGVRFTTEVSGGYEPIAGLRSYERSVVRYGAGIDAEVTATTQTHLPMYLPHSGPRRYDNNAISAATLGDRRGFRGHGVGRCAGADPGRRPRPVGLGLGRRVHGSACRRSLRPSLALAHRSWRFPRRRHHRFDDS